MPFIDMPGSFDDCWAGSQPLMRYHVRRRRRGLERAGDARIELVRGGTAIDDVLTDFFARIADRCNATGCLATSGNPRCRRSCGNTAGVAGRGGHPSTVVAGRRRAATGRADRLSPPRLGQLLPDGLGTRRAPSRAQASYIVTKHRASDRGGADPVRLSPRRGDLQGPWTDWAAEQTRWSSVVALAARAAMAAERLKEHVSPR